jgi:hypothetical protein
MEKNFFWAFFIIALIAGISLGFSVNNTIMTGQASRMTHGDSDGGIDPYEMGQCMDKFGNIKTDFCSGNFLHEFAFIEGECKEKLYDCTAYDMVCLNGYCS